MQVGLSITRVGLQQQGGREHRGAAVIEDAGVDLGRETLEDLNMIVFCGGFSNSDVLGSAKGWAAGFLYNEKAKQALDNFYKRKDTLSLGICNGCQLMVELKLINPEHDKPHACCTTIRINSNRSSSA